MAGTYHTAVEKQNMQYLSEAYLRGKLSHAYIIEGSYGTAKEAFADYLAQALLCDRNRRISQTGPEGSFQLTACGSCPSCIKALSGNHPDIIHVRHEKDTVLSVQEIREQVVADISIKPYYGPYKIYIVRDAELMNENAQNALLKTIEEPAEYGIILLLTDNADGFLQTIRSRCIRISMGAVPKEQMAAELLGAEGRQVLDVLHEVRTMDALKINKTAKEFEAEDKLRILKIMQLYVRDLLVQKSTGQKERLYFPDEFTGNHTLLSHISYEQIAQMQKAVQEAEDRLAASVKAEAVFETLLLALRRQMK